VTGTANIGAVEVQCGVCLSVTPGYGPGCLTFLNSPARHPGRISGADVRRKTWPCCLRPEATALPRNQSSRSFAVFRSSPTLLESVTIAIEALSEVASVEHGQDME
jgi:hypothetical protein